MLSRPWLLALACGLSLTLGCSKTDPAPEVRVSTPAPAAASPSSTPDPATSSRGATGASASQPVPVSGVQQPGTTFNFAPAPGGQTEPSSRSPLRAAAAQPQAAKVPEYPNAGVLNDPLTGKPPTTRQTTQSGQVLESGFDKEGRPFTRLVK